MERIRTTDSRPPILAVMFVVAVSLLVVAACSSAPSSAGPEPSPTATAEALDLGHEVEGPDDEGHELFLAKGCSACHGQNAEGTAAAPALPGHSATAVRRQVRAPIGLMPVFPPDKVSNAELEVLALWVASLSGGHAHIRSADVSQALTRHHWMALFALEGENVPEARHHVDHIIELVEGDHLNRMKAIAESLGDNDVHEGVHAIQEMLVGTVAPDLTEEDMHLKLALSAVRIADANEALHHIEHYIAIAPGLEQAEEIAALLSAGKFPEAESELESLLGGVRGEAKHKDSD